MLDVVVVNFNNWSQTAEYVNKINGFSCIDHIIIVDNHSTNNSFEKLELLCDDKVILIKTDKNGGYGYGNNFGVMHAISNYSPKYIAITNPDVSYTEDCIINCINFLNEHRDFALVAPTMKNPDGGICKCAWNLPHWYELAFGTLELLGRKVNINFLPFDESIEFQTCDCVKGSMLVIRSEVFVDVEGYDADIFLYSEENVLGFKFKSKNFKSAVLTTDFFIHERGTTISKVYKKVFSKKKLIVKSRLILLRKYYKIDFLKMLIVYISYSISLFESFIIDVFKSK